MCRSNNGKPRLYGNGKTDIITKTNTYVFTSATFFKSCYFKLKLDVTMYLEYTDVK